MAATTTATTAAPFVVDSAEAAAANASSSSAVAGSSKKASRPMREQTFGSFDKSLSSSCFQPGYPAAIQELYASLWRIFETADDSLKFGTAKADVLAVIRSSVEKLSCDFCTGPERHTDWRIAYYAACSWFRDLCSTLCADSCWSTVLDERELLRAFRVSAHCFAARSFLRYAARCVEKQDSKKFVYQCYRLRVVYNMAGRAALDKAVKFLMLGMLGHEGLQENLDVVLCAAGAPSSVEAQNAVRVLFRGAKASDEVFLPEPPVAQRKRKRDSDSSSDSDSDSSDSDSSPVAQPPAKKQKVAGAPKQ